MAVPPDATETEIDRPRLRTTRAGVATAGDGAIGGPGGWRWRRPLSARRCWRRGPPLVPGRRRGRRRRRRVCDAKPGRARPPKTAGLACAALLDHGRGRSVDSRGADAAVRPRRDRGAYRARVHGRRCYAGTGSRRLERWWAWALPLSWASPEEIASVVEQTRQLTGHPFGANLGLEWGQRERLAAALERSRTGPSRESDL